MMVERTGIVPAALACRIIERAFSMVKQVITRWQAERFQSLVP
jgi:hypothetical protein